MTYGTRGDIEPFLALALGLKDAGHDVTLATAEQFGDWVSDFGIDYAPITNASLDVIHSEDGKTMLEGGAGLFARIAAGARLARQSRAINEQLCRDAWRAAEATRPELILYHPKIMAAPHIAEKLAIPAILAALQPMLVPTAAFPVTGLPRLPVPGYNRFSYRFVNLSYGALKGSVNRFRRELLGLAPVRRAAEVLRPPSARASKVLHGLSPQVIPRPDDWPNYAIMSGYWPLPPDPAFTPPDELLRFLDAGPPPVYVGFGSMVSKDPEALAELVVEALRLAGVRGVLGAGWAGLAADADGVVAVRDIPYGWLFPQMAAVVHHGGAGTTAAGFRAGVPSVICPFFGDQPGWAAASVALGVGAPPVPRKRLSAERLAASIRVATSDQTLKRNAKRLAAALDAEDGIAVAIAEIEDTLQQAASAS
ncbi:glycosyltransferase [Haliangium ochraceum]|nr:glycosyltransferase [Haliangium ochraceum]